MTEGAVESGDIGLLTKRGGNHGRRPIGALVAVAVAFVAVVTVVAVKTPAWEAPDEPGHVRNVETLAAGHWYRIPLDSKSARLHAASLGNELHQPPLYYLLLAGFQRLVWQRAHTVMPGPTLFPDVARGVYPHHSSAQHRSLLLLRLPNIGLGLVAILFTFLAARLVTTDRWTPVIAAAVVAFVPRFVFLSAFVTNDNLVTALGAALAYAGLRCVVFKSLVWGAVVGAILGLLTVTKLSALPAFALLVPVLATFRGWRRRIQLVACTLAATLVACGWWLVQNQLRYGDPLASSASHRYLVAIYGLGSVFGQYVVSDPLHLIFYDVPSRIWSGFWYTSGGLNQFQWSWAPNLAFWLALSAALLGLRRGRSSVPEAEGSNRSAFAVLITLALAGFLTVWITAFSTAAYQPRLAFFGLPALACLAALGLERWQLPARLLLPTLGLGGAIVAIQQNVLNIRWHH
jgi:hypothetical protein